MVEFPTVRERIDEFLFKYDGYISFEDLHLILKFKNKMIEFENKGYLVSIHGEHFIDCPWSIDSCREGPDTCDCFIYRQRKRAVIYLIEMYNKYLSV